MRQVRAKVYLSDEGFGHIVRQRAILEELLKIEPGLEATLQTGNHIEFASKHVPATQFVERFNNIKWHKNADGSPDLHAIESYFETYIERSKAFINLEKVEANYDFLITDFVYEAMDLGSSLNIPVFGVGHFTWDWFFSKLYPRVLTDEVFDYLTQRAKKASALFFPPFTPQDILSYYKKTAIEVPFIVRTDVHHRSWPDDGKFKILIMDSGAGLLKPSIQKAIASINTNEFTIGVLEGTVEQGENIFLIPQNNLLVDYVKGADLVVGRPGFNTLSECIAYRVPMLLLSESMNPEMEHNIGTLKKRRLGAFMSKDDFENRFDAFLSTFIANEYANIQGYMNGHALTTNGAEVIARKILDRL